MRSITNMSQISECFMDELNRLVGATTTAAPPPEKQEIEKDALDIDAISLREGGQTEANNI